MATLSPTLIGEDVFFDRDTHSYVDVDGSRCLSVTQAITKSGLVDYSMVSAEVLAIASARGQLVHQACAIIDRGENLSDYELPAEINPYVESYLKFLFEMKFVADPEWVEQPIIVELFGHRIGMTPDSIGTIGGVPVLIERKATVAAHPAWALQTAGYSLGVQATGLQIRQRYAVQLLRTGNYKLHPHEDRGDFDSFGDVYRVAALKLKYRLVDLD